MKRKSIRTTPMALIGAAALLATVVTANATSHREAPMISNQMDPEITDIYVFQGIVGGTGQPQAGQNPPNATANTYSGSPQMPMPMPRRQPNDFDKSLIELPDPNLWSQ